jgi:two-component system chemotaxis response regulator CheB
MEKELKGPNSGIRVLVVDDSYFMRKLIAEVLDAPGTGMKVVETAKDGLDALEKARSCKPDVMTLDVEMPRLDGLATLQRLMREQPLPVVMLSSHTGEGTDATLRSLELGAVECVLKPAGVVPGFPKGVAQELVEKIRMASLSKVRPSRKEVKEDTPAPSVSADLPAQSAKFLVCVASSTGGPRALNEFFTALQPHPRTAVLVVQHISVGFTQALARRLGEVSTFQVSEALKGERLLGGRGYIAPAGQHLLVEGKPGEFLFQFSDVPPRLGVKPSADLLMSSVAKAAGTQCLGVVLTGMGRDGTQGLKDIHSVGAKTFAQCAESCVVYGMPKSAVEAGVVSRQLDLEPMAVEINTLLQTQV